jgi:hypothetical protein
MKRSQTNLWLKLKEFLNPNRLFITHDESGFCVDSNRSKFWAIKDSKPINLQVVQKPKSI